MNVQLRNSKTLQDALHKDSGRNALPKAQLHPELLEPYVDNESGGFIVRSENPIDMRNMENFLISGAVCTASWIKSGSRTAPTPSELIFAFNDGAKLVIRTQSAADVTRLTSSIPSDRTAQFQATYDDGQIVLVRAANEPEKPFSSKSKAELQVEAAKLGVKWDKTASIETMIERIEAKRVETVKA